MSEENKIKVDKATCFELLMLFERDQKFSNQMQTLEVQAMMIQREISSVKIERDEILNSLGVPEDCFEKVSVNKKDLEITYLKEKENVV